MQQLGLNTEHVDTLQLDSPFDFKRQSLLYQPPNLPDPNDREYTELLLESVLPLLQQLHGRTFMLFTSLRAMNFAAEWLEPRLDCVLLRQGKDQKHLLLQKFASSEDAILLGSISFWEGVDVVGPALSCVLIDKIPFESHHDLLFKARAQHVEVQGDHPFTRLQLPRAALMLKQGCGRLIRSISDRGLIVVGDPRLHTRSYGSTLLQSIPNMRITNDFSEASKFLETLQ